MRIKLILISLVLLLGLAFSYSRYGWIIMYPNTTVNILCKGADTFLVTFHGDTELEVTCRVWVR
jgi:hypothetical protein